MTNLKTLFAFFIALYIANVTNAQIASCTYTSAMSLAGWPDDCNKCVTINEIKPSYTICDGGTLTINPLVTGAPATPVSWTMTGPGSITPPSGSMPPFTPVIAITPPPGPGSFPYTFSVTAQAPNIVVDGGFETGLPRFCSGFYSMAGAMPGSIFLNQFAIVSDASQAVVDDGVSTTCPHASVPPHTGNGMLVTFGSPNMSVMWQENLEVCPGSTYTFSAWVYNLDPSPCVPYPFAVPQIDVKINGVSLGPITGVTGGWQQITFSWTAGAATTMADIEIWNATGNFAVIGLDDVEFSRQCTTQYAFTINTTGFWVFGVPNICEGTTTTLLSSPGGVWSGSTPVASVDPATGIVTGLSAGTVIFTYTDPGGCQGTVPMTVDPIPNPIVGPSDICLGSTHSYSVAPGPGPGAWFVAGGISGIAGVAITGPWDCTLTGIAILSLPASVVLSYVLPSGCSTAMTVFIHPNPTPPTVPPFTLCTGATFPVSSTPAGGTWSTSNPAVANVVLTAMPTTLTAIGPGIANIFYTTFPGCTTMATVAVQDCPGGSGGGMFMCVGDTATLPEPLPGGGVWTSLNPSIVSVSATGFITALATGTAIITYNVGGFTYTWTITVVGPPTACVTAAWDAGLGDYVFTFTGTGGATVTYDVFDTWGTLLGTLTTTIPGTPPWTGVVTVPYGYINSMVPPGTFQVCITKVTLGTCVGSCDPSCCCARINPALPRFATTSPSGSSADMKEVGQAVELHIIPNPTNGQLALIGNTGKELNKQVAVEVVDMVGKTVYTDKVNVKDGSFDKTIVLPQSLSNGMYFIRIPDKDVNAITRFVLTR